MVDRLLLWTYNTYMTQTTATRKKRVDRTHYVYMLEIGGLRYVGTTAKTESTARKSVMSRFNKHWYRAKTESKNWLLCTALRECDDRNEVEVKILAAVRGKKAGHAEEVRLRRELKPELNTDVRNDHLY